MGDVSVSLPNDGETADAVDYNVPITTIVNEINGNLDNSNIASDAAIVGTKLADGAITANKLDTAAITLGYTQITTGLNTGSASDVAATGLTASVTIPAGGRKVKITAYSPAVGNTNANRTSFMSIWNGGVGIGTRLAEASLSNANAAANAPMVVMAVHTPSAGAITYNVGYHTDGAGVVVINAEATSPSFILVEAI